MKLHMSKHLQYGIFRSQFRLNKILSYRKYNCCRHGQAITPLQKVYEKSKLCNGASYRINITQSFSLLLLAAFIRLRLKKERKLNFLSLFILQAIQILRFRAFICIYVSLSSALEFACAYIRKKFVTDERRKASLCTPKYALHF